MGLRQRTEARPKPTVDSRRAFDKARSKEDWKLQLEDPDQSKETWKIVREVHKGTFSATGYGTLLGVRKGVEQVLRNKDGKYSVCGYGERMEESIGKNYLGMDGTEHDTIAKVVNPVIYQVTEEKAFKQAMEIVEDELRNLPPYDGQGSPGTERYSIDLVSLSDAVLAELCARWFGVPTSSAEGKMVAGGRVDYDGKRPVRCPGHLLGPSRYIFTPHPNKKLKKDAGKEGKGVLAAVEAAGELKGTLTSEIRDALKNRLEGKPDDTKSHNDILSKTIAGMLLGFPPTVQGNFLRTMETWIDEEDLWKCQEKLAKEKDKDAYKRVSSALKSSLLDTMRKRPVPEMLWRKVKDEKTNEFDPNPVVLGIASALTNESAPNELMFGGKYGGDNFPHACPAFKMSIGVMLALIAGVLDAGTLRPTGSPVLLMLTKHMRKNGPPAQES